MSVEVAQGPESLHPAVRKNYYTAFWLRLIALASLCFMWGWMTGVLACARAKLTRRAARNQNPLPPNPTLSCWVPCVATYLLEQLGYTMNDYMVCLPLPPPPRDVEAARARAPPSNANIARV